MTIPRPDLEIVVDLYGSCLPDCDYMLRKIESEKKWLKFSPRLHQLTKNLKCQNYPELYQDEFRLLSAFLRGITKTDEEAKQLLAELGALSIDEQTQRFNEFVKEIAEIGSTLDQHLVHIDDIDLSPSVIEEHRRNWEQLSQEEQKQCFRITQNLHMFFLASFFNIFSVMVHRRKLTQLVQEAMQGNDESFCLALQVDKNILQGVPYFRERHQQALNEGDHDFLKAVGKYSAKPHLQGRIQHRRLFLLFAMLEYTHWLDELKYREILDICDQVQFERYENRIETEDALGDRLRDYRKFQKINQMSMA